MVLMNLASWKRCRVRLKLVSLSLPVYFGYACGPSLPRLLDAEWYKEVTSSTFFGWKPFICSLFTIWTKGTLRIRSVDAGRFGGRKATGSIPGDSMIGTRTVGFVFAGNEDELALETAVSGTRVRSERGLKLDLSQRLRRERLGLN